MIQNPSWEQWTLGIFNWNMKCLGKIYNEIGRQVWEKHGESYFIGSKKDPQRNWVMYVIL